MCYQNNNKICYKNILQNFDQIINKLQYMFWSQLQHILLKFVTRRKMCLEINYHSKLQSKLQNN